MNQSNKLNKESNLQDIAPRGFDLLTINLKRIYPMSQIINWKTTVLGILIVIVKFLGSTFGLSPDLINSIVTILTAILGWLAGDGAAVAKLQKQSENKLN